MLVFKNVSKTYAKSTTKAVDGLNLEVKSGEIFGFLGPNGAGKSTTIKMLTGILTIDEGSVEIDGFDVKKSPQDAKLRIGYVPDNHAVYEKLTGAEYLNFIGTVYGVPVAERTERAKDLLEKFELNNAVNEQISTYSHGMRQKIVIIGALLSNPKLWVMDEPLTGLDPQSAFELKQLMRRHADAGNTVFFSSHVIDVVEKVCDRVGIIKEGKLIDICTMDELKEKSGNESLEEYFLRITAKDEDSDEAV